MYYKSKAEKAMATHSSTPAWNILWVEEPGRLQSMGSGRVRHDWATSLSLFTFLCWGRQWQPTPVFLPGESQGRVSQSLTRLKRLSSSSSSVMFIPAVYSLKASSKQIVILMSGWSFPQEPVIGSVLLLFNVAMKVAMKGVCNKLVLVYLLFWESGPLAILTFLVSLQTCFL